MPTAPGHVGIGTHRSCDVSFFRPPSRNPECKERDERFARPRETRRPIRRREGGHPRLAVPRDCGEDRGGMRTQTIGASLQGPRHVMLNIK